MMRSKFGITILLTVLLQSKKLKALAQVNNTNAFDDDFDWDNCIDFSDDWMTDWDDDEARSFEKCRNPPSAAPSQILVLSDLNGEFNSSVCEADYYGFQNLPKDIQTKCRLNDLQDEIKNWDWDNCIDFSDDWLTDWDDDEALLYSLCQNPPTSMPKPTPPPKPPFDFSICGNGQNLKQKDRRQCRLKSLKDQWDWDNCIDFSDDWLTDWDDDEALLYELCQNPPSSLPSKPPSMIDTTLPTKVPSISPTFSPTISPTSVLTTSNPTISPTEEELLEFDPAMCQEFDDDELFANDDELLVKCRNEKSKVPSIESSTLSPSKSPVLVESLPTSIAATANTLSPSEAHFSVESLSPSFSSTDAQTISPTKSPVVMASMKPSALHSSIPTSVQSGTPSISTNFPTGKPTTRPTPSPTSEPTPSPSSVPTESPTTAPTPAVISSTPIPEFTLQLETSENGPIDAQTLIDTTTTFLTFQYLKHFELTYIEMNLVDPSSLERNRKTRSLATAKAIFEGTAFFTSVSTPTSEELATVTENAFDDGSDEGLVLFVNLLKSTQDIVLASIETVSIDLESDRSELNKNTDGSNAAPSRSRRSMIPIFAGAAAALSFLIGAIVLARKYGIFKTSDIDMEFSKSPSSMAERKSFPNSDSESELQYEIESNPSNLSDSYSVASSAYNYSVAYPNQVPGVGTSTSALGSYISDSEDESIEEISLDSRRFKSIMGQKSNRTDFKKVWKDAQTPDTRIKSPKYMSAMESQNRSYLSSDDDIDFDVLSDIGSDLTGISGLK